IASLAAPISGWIRTAARAADVARDLGDAVRAALTPPGHVATLVVPADCQWDPGQPADVIGRPNGSRPLDPHAIDRAVTPLSDGTRTPLLLGGAALEPSSLRIAADIAAASNCELLTEAFPARLAYGRGFPRLTRVPYMVEAAAGLLGHLDRVLLCGAARPVAF